jgi:endonuclease/exonuclease/phosphatase family metal-dependent hydrolase
MQRQHCFLYGDDFLLHLLQFSSAAGIQNFFTGILYCIHHDVHWWKDPQFNHSYHMRNISWAKFSSLADPSDEFIVANTHWSYRTEHANGNTFLAGASQPIAANELRDQCRMETYGMLESIRQKHSETPTFLLGDFNTSLSFFTQSGWTPPYFHIISDEAMHAGTALAVVPDSGHFDHLFGTGNYTISRYEYVKNVNFMELLTDHPFAYADLIF